MLRSLYPDWSPRPKLNPGHPAELALAYGSLPSDPQPRCFVIAISLQPSHKVAAHPIKAKGDKEKAGKSSESLIFCRISC